MNKLFPFLLFCTSILIAGTAAFFSVKGIGLLFMGSFLPVVVMASSLEVGKLFAISFLYRRWSIIPRFLKVYLSLAVAMLVVITSLGIFGFLSDAYQHTKNKVNYIDTKIESLQSQNVSLEDQIKTRQQSQLKQQSNSNTNVDRYKQIYDDYVAHQNVSKKNLLERLQTLDEQLQQLKNSQGGLFSNKKKELEKLEADQLKPRETINNQLTTIQQNIDAEYNKFLSKVDQANAQQQDTIDPTPLIKRIEDNNKEILELQSKVSDTDIGSFKFIAQSFNIDVDSAVKWFIVMIVVVFDPLAMCLILGYNVYVTGNVKGEFEAPRSVIPTSVVDGKKRVLIRPIKTQ